MISEHGAKTGIGILPFHYRWVVAAACFLCCATYGTFYSFGIFFKPLQEQFGWSATSTASVQSVHIIIYIASSLVVGWATDRFGPRRPLIVCALCIGIGYLMCSRIQTIGQLILSYSIASMGAGLVWSLPMSTVQRWFTERRGLALGITVSGIGIGTMVWAPVANYVIEHFGWRTAYVIMGLFTGTVLCLAALLVAFPEKKDPMPPKPAVTVPVSKKKEAAGIDLHKALRTRTLWLICVFQFFFNVGIFLAFVHLVPFAIQNGIDKAAAAVAVGLMGGLSVFGRIISPVVIENRMQSQWAKGLAICGVVATVMFMFLVQVHSLWMLYLFVIVMGYFYGSWIPLVVALIGSSFGLKHLGTLLGITQIGLLGGILGPLLGGMVYDRTGTYTPAFVISAVSFFIATIIAFIIHHHQKMVRNLTDIKVNKGARPCVCKIE